LRKRSNRPLVERLPYIAIRDIAKLIPRHNPTITVNPDAYGWRYPGKVLISTLGLKITDHGAPQLFKFKWVRIGLGKQRLGIVCQCRRTTHRLFYWQGRYACRHCQKADYLCQHLSGGRKRLWQAARLRLQLNGSPNDYALPKRPKGKHRKHYLHAIDKIASLEQKLHNLRNRTIDVRCFAYHIAR
jgi:hypothetical protein